MRFSFVYHEVANTLLFWKEECLLHHANNFDWLFRKKKLTTCSHATEFQYCQSFDNKINLVMFLLISKY